MGQSPGAPDNDGRVVDPTAQLRIYWSLKELQVLMEIGIDPENT
ncbi:MULTISPECIES: hypothetical protein [Desulfococcus]|jgi:hypothetical protein|nr:hypothetical protein [Desulfococcus multivorans]MDX9817360.1 hypothetical protein [Desulfococcus multivorans]